MCVMLVCHFQRDTPCWNHDQGAGAAKPHQTKTVSNPETIANGITLANELAWLPRYT